MKSSCSQPIPFLVVEELSLVARDDRSEAPLLQDRKDIYVIRSTESLVYVRAVYAHLERSPKNRRIVRWQVFIYEELGPCVQDAGTASSDSLKAIASRA